MESLKKSKSKKNTKRDDNCTYLSSTSSHVTLAPLHNTTDTSDCSSPSIKLIKEFLRSKNNDLKNLSSEELIGVLDKLFERGKFRNCIKLCHLAMKLENFNSVSAIVKFILARCHKSLNEVDLAIDLFLNLMSEIQIQVPLSSIFDSVSEIIENHTTEQNKQLSIVALYKCLKRRIQNSDGKCVESRFKLASLCMNLNNPDDAIQEFRAVLELEPDNIAAMLNLSSLYMSSQNSLELGKIYIKIADFLKSQINLNNIDLDNPESEVNKCFLYYNEALKLLPENIEILICLASVSRMTERHKESLGYIEQALRLDNKDYRVYYEAFLTYEAIGDFHTAKMMIRLCLFLNVSFVKAFNAFGNLMRREKMYDCALSLFETALLRVPEDSILLNNYGTTFLEMGDKFKAKEIYLQAFFLDSNSFEINCNLALIYKMECIIL